MRKIILSVILTMFFCQGCETLKGAAQGAQKDIDTAVYHATDSNGGLKKADRWIQEHLW